MNKTLVAVIAILTLLPGLAFGAVQTISFPTSTPIPATLTEWVGQSLAFQQFDPSLGTLVKVTIDLSASMDTVLTITNDSDTPSSGTAETELQISVQDAGLNLITPQIDMFSAQWSYNLGANDSTTSGLLTKTGTSSNDYTSAAVFTEFTGLGTVVLPGHHVHSDVADQ